MIFEINFTPEAGETYDAVSSQLQERWGNKVVIRFAFGTIGRSQYFKQSEILNGKRKLSLSMIRKLHKILYIPAQSLIAEY